jgi:hypothetical protein
MLYKLFCPFVNMFVDDELPLILLLHEPDEEIIDADITKFGSLISSIVLRLLAEFAEEEEEEAR